MNQVNFRVTDEELKHLKRYGEIKERQQSEVIRELIGKLSIDGVQYPIN